MFKNLTDGKYRIVVEPKDHFLGYETEEKVVKGELTKIKIFLPKDLLNPYELTVVSKKAKKEVTKQVISVKELLKIPGTNGDAIRVVQNLPGMSRAGGLSGDIIIRGSGNNESKVFIDGYEVPLIYHFGGLASVYNSELLEDVAYYPGGYSVRYGRSLGGVVDVKTRLIKTKKENKNIHGYLDIDLMDTSAMVEVPIDDDSAMAVAFRRSYIDVVLDQFIPESENISLSLPVYYDWQIHYNRKLTPKDTLSFVHWGSDDSFKLIVKGDLREENNIEGDFSVFIYSNTSKIDWEHKFNKKLKSKMSSGVEFSKTEFNVFNIIKYDVKVWNIPLRADLEYKLNKNLTINTGLDIRNQFYSRDLVLPSMMTDNDRGGRDETRDINDIETEENNGSGITIYPAIYTELIWNLGKFKFIPGIRLDYFSNANYLSIDPRLGVLYQLNKDLVLKASSGIFHLPPDIFQTDEVFGNPDILPSFSNQNSLGLEYKATEFITSSIEFFYNRQYDLIVSSPEKVIVDGEFRDMNIDNTGDGRAYGMEIFIRHNMSSRFFGWISYTLMKSERRDTLEDNWEPFQYDQTHILTVLGSYKLPWGFEIGAKVRYVTGSPTTPTIGSIYNVDSDSYTPISGVEGSTRNQPFFQADLRIDKTWQYQYWTLNAYIDIQNVTYYKNQEGIKYNYDYTESEPVEGLPIFPSFGIKGEF